MWRSALWREGVRGEGCCGEDGVGGEEYCVEGRSGRGGEECSAEGGSGRGREECYGEGVGGEGRSGKREEISLQVLRGGGRARDEYKRRVQSLCEDKGHLSRAAAPLTVACTILYVRTTHTCVMEY